MKLKIGLEVHVPITALETKLFCSCPNPAKYKSKQNTIVCPICLGMPGALPKPNRHAIILGIRVAKALNCKVANEIIFYRKHYFYPDLPKGYQISQYDRGGAIPLAWDGYVLIRGDDGKYKRIRIRRIQIEEDPARLIYPSSIKDSPYVLIDFNRSGTPLFEIITEPDLSTAKEARAFLEKLQEILIAVGAITGDVSTNIRCDANVSVKGGERVEIKNIGSFKEVEKALNFEIMRMKKYVERGIKIERETRHWDARRKITVTLRAKEEEADYRYFPDPNIPPIQVDESMIDDALKDFPELPDDIMRRLMSEGINEEIAWIIVHDRNLIKYFDAARPYNDPKLVAKVVVNELREVLKLGIKVDEKYFVQVIRKIKNYSSVRSILRDVLAGNKDISELDKHRKLLKKASVQDVEEVIGSVIKSDKKLFNDARSKEKALNLLVWKIKNELEKKGLEAEINEIERSLKSKLAEKTTLIKEKIKSSMHGNVAYLDKYIGYEVKEHPHSFSAKRVVIESESVRRGRLRISDIFSNKPSDKIISVVGWLERYSHLGNVAFAIIRDWTGKIQVKLSGNLARVIKSINKESFILVRGEIVKDDRAPGGIELHATSLKVIAPAKNLALSPKELLRSSVDVRLAHRDLYLRTRKMRAILRFRSSIINILRRYLLDLGFVEIDTPKIIATATEGGAELFPILYYGREAFLAQSPQLYKQLAINAFEKVFEVGHYFRAQEFDTPRHLSEFCSFDVEVALIDLEGLLDLIESMIKTVIISIKESSLYDELKEIGFNLNFYEEKFRRITYREAIELLQNKNLAIKWGDDITGESLRKLSEEIGAPFFITYWPKATRAFYYRIIDNELTASFDLIWPTECGPLELSSGGEREYRIDKLREALRERGLFPEAYGWYISMFERGIPPHGGFGLGIDRLVQALLNLDTILETTISPRSPKYYVP